MLRALITAALFVACNKPLAPGETRCVSGDWGTKCRSAPPAEPSAAHWWCAYDNDGGGICKHSQNGCAEAADAAGINGSCQPRNSAYCSSTRCTPTLTSCAAQDCRETW